jgi:hypothetical protein
MHTHYFQSGSNSKHGTIMQIVNIIVDTYGQRTRKFINRVSNRRITPH